jgi:hypothetical protein
VLALVGLYGKCPAAILEDGFQSADLLKEDSLRQDELREQAWDFFHMQAGQRMTTFNFYIAIASLLSTGLAASFKVDVDFPLLGVALGLLLIVFSLIFWKLDERNRELIKGAERTLMYFERLSGLPDQDGKPHLAKRFTLEEAVSKEKRAKRSWCLWKNEYSYYECFKLVFAIFGVVGFAGGICSAFRVWKLGSSGVWL